MKQLADETISDYIEAIAARRSTPGGGAVAAITAAEACGLIAMVINFTKGNDDVLASMKDRTTGSISRLLALADEDSRAFERVMKAYKSSSDSGDEKEKALAAAAEVPLKIINICSTHVEDIEHLKEHGNANLISDVAIAAHLLQSTFSSCELNVLVNVKAMAQPGVELTDPLSALPDLNNRLTAVCLAIKSQLA
jgi:formiminotetrahydrofolate cyclodeaminase